MIPISQNQLVKRLLGINVTFVGRLGTGWRSSVVFSVAYLTVSLGTFQKAHFVAIIVSEPFASIEVLASFLAI